MQLYKSDKNNIGKIQIKSGNILFFFVSIKHTAKALETASITNTYFNQTKI